MSSDFLAALLAQSHGFKLAVSTVGPSRKAVTALTGEPRIRDLPRESCIAIIDLRLTAAQPVSA